MQKISAISPLNPLLLLASVKPSETIIFLQTDFNMHMIIKANALSKQGFAPLQCSHFEKYRSVHYSTWSQPLLFSFAQGKEHNLHFKASIKLVADKTPFWRGTTAQQIGSSTQWSGEGKTLLGWCIVTHRVFLVGWGREKEWWGTGGERNPADQCLLPLFIQCPQPCVPRDFPDYLIFVRTYKC